MKLNILLAIIFAGYFTEGAKILALFPYQGRSHNVMFEPLVIGLVRAGHSVDVVSHFPPEKPVPAGFNHISLKGTLHYYVNNMTVSMAQELTPFIGIIKFISDQGAKDLCNLMRLPQLQNILNAKTKYDIMLTEALGTNCYLGVARKLKLPVIGVVPCALYPWSSDPFFDSDNPSYVPSQMSALTVGMGFFERVKNLYVHVTSKLLFLYYDKTVSEPLAKQYFHDLPPLLDLYYNISLLLVNSHFSINGARPISPAVIEVAGLHLDETQELTEDLEIFLNSAKDGVVYFSMGSMVKSETFSTERIHALYESFAQFPKYKVLWKGKIEEMPEGLPSNVKMVPWAPQYAVLRHPNVKAFVTHGGLMGTLEAIHAAVPMIGIPFFCDQMSNIAGYVRKGIAVRVDYEDLSKSSFSNALHEILTDPSYKSNMDRVSKLFKDRRLPPMDEAIYWIEYVIRNGGESLKPFGIHLYWFQYYLIDVGLFLLIVSTLVLTVLFLIFRKILNTFKTILSSVSTIKTKTS